MKEQVLFAVRIGDADWKEVLITENPLAIEVAKEWALKNGFDRLRVATIDMSQPLENSWNHTLINKGSK